MGPHSIKDISIIYIFHAICISNENIIFIELSCEYFTTAIPNNAAIVRVFYYRSHKNKNADL